MKKFTAILCVLLIVTLLTAVFCSCDKEEEFDPWDHLGGNQNGTDIGDTSDETADGYINDDIKNDNSDTNGSYDESSTNTYIIDLNSITTADLSDVSAYSYKKNELTIKSNGVYVLSGKLSGAISVKDTDGEVQLVLAGVEITTTDDQTVPAIVFKKPDGDTISDRVLTVKDGTENILSDSVGDNATDGDGAVIQAKKRSLVINGTGKLTLNCKGEETSGIKVKTSLTVNGPTIVINDALKNGIKADEQIIIKNADITVKADNDGIKTDMEPSTEEEAKLYASDSKYGYIYIENSNLDIVSGDDGISANNCLYIANTDANTIKIQTNGGSPNAVTEYGSDNADGKAIKTGGIEFNDIDYPASYSDNYGLVITGGNFVIDSNDDAIHSKGNVLITGGTFEISTYDDGIHAEYLNKIVDGNINITKSYEGIEGATVEILGGNIKLYSKDDGINAANGDLRNYSFYILISGGKIDIDADGDGIDSNGTFKMTGGDVTVYGPTDNANGSLDADTGILVTGGNLCAVGSAGMVENPSKNSTQYYVSLTLSSYAYANTKVTVTDEDGNELFTTTPTKRFQSVIISLECFEKGKTYIITVGDDSYEATLDSIGTAIGTNMNGHGNQGFMPGGPGGGPGHRW